MDTYASMTGRYKLGGGISKHPCFFIGRSVANSSRHKYLIKRRQIIFTRSFIEADAHYKVVL
jgi:hypothetical protein